MFWSVTSGIRPGPSTTRRRNPQSVSSTEFPGPSAGTTSQLIRPPYPIKIEFDQRPRGKSYGGTVLIQVMASGCAWTKRPRFSQLKYPTGLGWRESLATGSGDYLGLWETPGQESVERRRHRKDRCRQGGVHREIGEERSYTRGCMCDDAISCPCVRRQNSRSAMASPLKPHCHNWGISLLGIYQSCGRNRFRKGALTIGQVHSLSGNKPVTAF